jgi:WD repeat-containing protein 48
MEEEGDDYNVATPMEQKPSAAFILAKQDYEDRETALDGVPLRDGPDDVIRGRHGLVRSEMLNDKRTVITLDTYGDVAVWDIVLGGCIGRFRKSDLRQAYKSSMYINGNNDKKETDYENEQDTSMDLDDLLNFVRTTIEGEAVVASWCSVETKTGLLTVHVEQNRAFDAEVYIDEAGVPPKPEYRVDQRLNMGKWVIRNLFEGFIAAELKNQARGRTSSISSSTHSSVSASGAALQMRPTTSSSSSAGSSALGQRRPSHISIPDAAGAQASHFGQTPAVFSIALATPAMTPAVLPDVSDLAAQMASPRLFSSSLASTSTTQSNLPTIPQSPQGAGSVPSTPMSAVQREGDYFSFNRPKSSSSEAGPLGAVTPKPFSTIPSTPSAANLGPSAGASAPRASKMSRFKSFARRESRKESFTDPAPVQEEEKVLAPTAEEDAEAHLTPAEKAQQRLLRAIFSHPLQPSTASETPALPFVSNIPIMIGEESHDAGAWATVYRGLVSTAGQDAATLELNMPAWLLEFTLHNVIPQKDQPKIAFIMEPWGGPEKAGLPELPSG